MTSIVPTGPEDIVAPVASRISFTLLITQVLGRIILVDPDIPKHIV